MHTAITIEALAMIRKEAQKKQLKTLPKLSLSIVLRQTFIVIEDSPSENSKNIMRPFMIIPKLLA